MQLIDNLGWLDDCAQVTCLMMALPAEVSGEEEAAGEPADTSVADVLHVLRCDGFTVSNLRLVNVSQVRLISSRGDCLNQTQRSHH